VTSRFHRSVLAAGPALLATAIALLGCGGGSSPGADTHRPYNLVVFLSDALRASNLELYGYPRVTAPGLTHLAGESVVFDHHLAGFPGTPTSVSQIMTGRLMPPLLMDAAYSRWPVRALTDDLLILPRELRRRGYSTGIVSSHFWFNERARILQFFDHRQIVLPEEGEPYAPYPRLVDPIERMLDDFEAAPETPFFLYVHSLDTHAPYHVHPPPDSYPPQEGWPRVFDAYDSEITYTDRWLGKVLDDLRRRGLLESTVLVFTSDHGEELGEMGPEYWNRSHGNTIRRVQLHVPLIVRLPGGRRGGERISAPTSHVDLAQTLLGLADPGSDRGLGDLRTDGRDLGPLIEGRESPEPRTLVAYTWRYWGLFEGAHELHYDQWRDRFDLYETQSVNLNYPLSAPLDEPELARRLTRELRPIVNRRTRERIDAPLPAAPPDDAVIGLPTTVIDRTELPSYEHSLDDGRWWLCETRLLEAGPEERPGPVALATAWVPGSYRIRVRLDGDRVEEGWKNRFRLRIGEESQAVALSGADADGDGLLDAGVHDLGRLLAVEISAPRGGVAITGFRLTRVGSDEAGASTDGELEKRLRALGYVQ
jgi:arylsulfatase A-like enzyme